MQKILFGFVALMTLTLTLFLNGNISIPNNPLPPFGKFLNPFGGIWSSDNRNEKGDQQLHFSGLKDKVEIIYDDRRVAHIFAQNLDDALFAQGYVEAQNRLFQMEFLAKAAAGELSTIFGNKTIEIDRANRRRGMKFAAENAVEGWQKFENFKTLTKYMDGVNAYIESMEPKDYPFEFKLFDLKPTPWTPLKTALIFKQMSLTLAGRNDDIESTNLSHVLGTEDFNLLFPERESVENPVIPKEKPYMMDSIYGKTQDVSAYYDEPILKSFYENRDKGVGSNSWGVAGSKTKSGKPIFCNDPHLSLGLPSIWFEIHIHTPEINAYGVSFPGFPGIMIGFNEYAAWGETNVGQDVEDVYAIKWTNPERTKYMLDGKETEIKNRIEKIEIKGSKTISDTVKYTHWGPIFKTSTDGKCDLAMRWIAHDVPDIAEHNTFIDALSCKNYDDYKKATGKYISPAQNFGFASVSGDIALRVNGRFPAKHGQDGRFVEYGEKSSNGWIDYIPREQNPQIINPERGYISSANQVSADKTYPYYFTGKFERFRNRSVNGKLDSMQNITPEDMMKMQQDAFSYKASDLMALVKINIDETQLSPEEKANYKLLSDWDFIYKSSSETPTLFDLFFKKLVENTWDELIEIRKSMDIKLPESWRLIELIKTDSGNKYFDIVSTKNKEDAKAVILKSFKESVAEFEKRNKEGQNNTWGGYKPLHIYHLTRLPALSEMDVQADGCPDAINATGYSFGPSWRMVISLEDKIKAYAVYPGGQSGNPTSKFYKNMIPAWTKGEYFSLNFVNKKEELEQVKTQYLLLNPKQ